MKRNILIVIDQMGEGGAQEVVENIINNLPSKGHLQIDLLVCFPSPNSKERIIRLGSSPKLRRLYTIFPVRSSFFKKRLFFLLLKLILYHLILPVVLVILAHKNKYATIHSNLNRATLLVARIMPFLPHNTATMVTIHTNYHLSINRQERMVFNVANKYDSIVLEIAHSREEAKSFFDLQKISYIPFSFQSKYKPSALLASDRAYIRGSLHIGEQTTCILCINRLQRGHKRIDIFIQAADLLRRSGMHFKLVIVGDGDNKQFFYNMTKEFSLEECITFTGHRDDLISLYAASDVYLSFSVGREVGIAGLQAIGCGIPVIALETLEAETGDNDFVPFVKAYDARDISSSIREVAADRLKWADFALRASRYVHSNYSEKIMAARYYQHYITAGARIGS